MVLQSRELKDHLERHVNIKFHQINREQILIGKGYLNLDVHFFLMERTIVIDRLFHE